MSDLSQDEREKLPLDDFGDPGHRLYPIVDASDVDDAAHLLGKADDREAVKRRIIAIAKRKGFALPDAWKDEGKGDGEDGAKAGEGKPVSDDKKDERAASPVTAAQALTEFQKAARQPQPASPPATPAAPSRAENPRTLQPTPFPPGREPSTTPPLDVFCIPITRIDQAKRWVEGIATSEGLDTFGTVFDYEASKRAFAEWAGNVREMHDRTAVGRNVGVRVDESLHWSCGRFAAEASAATRPRHWAATWCGR